MSSVESAPHVTLGHPVLDALHRASRPDVGEPVFEREFLARLLGVVHGSGIAIWFDPGGETLYLRYKRDLPQEELQQDPESWKKHGVLLKALAKRGEPGLVPAGWTEGEAGNPTPRELLIAPALVLGEQRIVLEVFRDAGTAETRPRDQDLRLIQTAAQFAADRVRAQQVTLLMQSQQESRKLDRFAQQVHTTLDVEATSYMIVNEAAALLGCDRVSLAVRRRNDAVIRAVSGKSDVNRRANLVRLQEKLAKAVLKSPTPVVVGARVRQYEPEFEEVVSAYQTESGAQTLFAVPLRVKAEDKPVGVLFLEQFDDRINAEQLAEQAGSVAAHATTSLIHAQQHEQVWLGSMRRRIGGMLRESFRVRRLLLWAILAGVVAAMVLMRVPLRMDAGGELRAQVRSGIFAPEAGTVREVKADHGLPVQQGDTLIVLENTELQVQLHQTQEELASATETLKIKETELAERSTPQLRKIQLDGEIAELQERMSFLKGQAALLQTRIDKLTLPAPIGGIVGTWNPERQLQDRPVSPGALLLSVIDEKGPWRLEVKLPEVDAGPVLAAWQSKKPDETIPVEYLLATHPEERYHGVIEDVAIRTENLEEQPTIRVVVAPDPEAMPPLRDGAEVRCKINCGERSLGYVVFRELVEFVHSRVLFLF